MPVLDSDGRTTLMNEDIAKYLVDGNETALRARVARCALPLTSGELKEVFRGLNSVRNVVVESGITDRTKIEEVLRSRLSWYPPETTSPIQRLPDNLLSEIFVSLANPANLPDDFIGPLDSHVRNESYSDACRSRQALLLLNKCLSADASQSGHVELRATFENMAAILSQVCKRWRNVAVDIPVIWSRIFFHPGRVAAYLERSKSHPLDIIFNAPRGASAGTLTAMLALIVQHSERWRSFRFSAHFRDQIKCALNMVISKSTPAPQAMRFFQLDHEGHYKEKSGTQQLRTAAQMFPRGWPVQLRSLTLRSVDVNWDRFPKELRLQHLHLESFGGGCPQWRHLSKVLRSSASTLETLYFGLLKPRSFTRPHYVAEDARLSLSALHTMWLDGNSPAVAEVLFSQVVFPALQNAKLETLHDKSKAGDHSAAIEALSLLSPEAFSNLSQLAICGWPGPSRDQITELYSRLNDVVKLELSNSGQQDWGIVYGEQLLYTDPIPTFHRKQLWYDALLESLATPGDDATTFPILLPSLTHIDFEDKSLEGQRVRQWVQYRHNAGHPLRRLVVERWIPDPESDTEDRAWLAENIEEFEIGQVARPIIWRRDVWAEDSEFEEGDCPRKRSPPSSAGSCY